MENKEYRDETFNRAMKFVDNFQPKHHGVSNIYVFTSVDKDGNIVSEKYGMNLMTNTGFSAIYASGSSFAASSSLRLYVGSGNSDITVNDTGLESQAFGGLAATFTTTSDKYIPIDGTSKAYNYPMYFSKGENDGDGLITLISRFMIAYYDYNISNYPNETYLSEYGIGTSANNLWTHSHIYDINGNKASMLKTPNERLYITVYMCLSFYESVIQNGWEEKRFTAITRNDIMYNRMYGSYLYTYKRGNKKVDRTGSPSKTMDTKEKNSYTNSTIMPSFTMYDGYDDVSGYFDGFIFYYTGMMIIEPQFLEEAEDIVIENYHSVAPYRYTGFAEKFGTYPSSSGDYTKEKYPPITHLTDVTVNMYDWKSQTWTNKMDVYNPNDKWYDETPSSTTCALPIYYSNNGKILTGYLYQNLRPDDKITAVTSGGITIYATDKYWDYSTWIWIQDYNNIPDKAKTARYWITNNNTESLTFVRESDNFKLLEKGTDKTGYEEYSEFPEVYNCYPQCDNYAYGWYLRDNVVYVPSIRQKFTVGNSGTTASEHMTYDKWLITFNSENNSIYVTDMTNAKNGNVSPSKTTVNFNGTVNSLTQCYRTESGTGIICMQSTNTQEANIIKMKGGVLNQEIKQWKMSCAIWGTHKVAYIPANEGDSKKIYIYDFDKNSIDGEPISFPEGVDSVPFMFGHTNFLWFTNGATFGYVVDLRNEHRTTVGYDNIINYNSNLYRVKITAVDDVLIIYNYSECGSNAESKAHYIRITNEGVKAPIPMSDFNTSNSYYGTRIDYILRYLQRDESGSKNVGTLMLLICRGYYSGASNTTNGSHNRVIDFGQYLAKNEIHQWSQTANTLSNYHLYGENIIYRIRQKVPAPNFMPIKLEGKSDTISAFNYIKNVSNKTWLISYTNTPTWGYEVTGKGTPPGVPLAKTDKDGTITGWS